MLCVLLYASICDKGNLVRRSNEIVELLSPIDLRPIKNGRRKGNWICIHLKNVIGLVLQIFLKLEAFKCYATSDWLKPSGLANQKLCDIQFTNLGEKDKEYS